MRKHRPIHRPHVDADALREEQLLKEASAFMREETTRMYFKHEMLSPGFSRSPLFAPKYREHITGEVHRALQARFAGRI